LRESRSGPLLAARGSRRLWPLRLELSCFPAFAMQHLVEDGRTNSTHRLKIKLTATAVDTAVFQAANGLQRVYGLIHARHGARWGIGTYDPHGQCFELVVCLTGAPTPPARPLTASNVQYLVQHAVVAPHFAATGNVKSTCAVSLAAAVTEYNVPGVEVFGAMTQADVQQIADGAGRAQALTAKDTAKVTYLREVIAQDKSGALPMEQRILVDEKFQVEVAARSGVQGFMDKRQEATDRLMAKDMSFLGMCVELGNGAQPYVQGAADSLTDSQFEVA
jgi:hypothetical protein